MCIIYIYNGKGYWFPSYNGKGYKWGREGREKERVTGIGELYTSITIATIGRRGDGQGVERIGAVFITIKRGTGGEGRELGRGE